MNPKFPKGLIAIDPGVSTGAAVFRGGELALCWVGDPRFFGVGHMVIECPQAYAPRLSKGDPNDLIKLAVRVGRYVEAFELQTIPTEMVLPNEWKGQIDKEIHHRRAEKRVSPNELEIWAHAKKGLSKKATLDLGDAVALGLWRLGRLPR